MSNILPFKRPDAPRQGLCQHGFHRWKVVQEKKFDVRQGKLVTIWQCERCGEQKVKAL